MTTQTTRPAWDHRLELSGVLGRSGIEVALATLGEPPTNVQLEETLRIPSLQIFPGRFANGWKDDDWNEAERAAAWLLHLEEHVEPDIVHLDSYALGAVPFRAPRLLEGHHCPVCRDQALSGATASVLWERYRQAVQCALRESRMVVTPTVAALDELTRAFGALPEFRVIPAGRCPRRFQPGNKEDLILAAGCFGDEAQNLPALEAVAADVAWPVAVLVEDPAGETAASPRSVRVIERPSRDQLASWYARASVFAQPCRYEPMGVSALEAALAGCALVLGDVPSLRETWEGAALFVVPGDPSDLKRALELVINEPKGRRGLAQRARTRALQLSPERRAAAFLEAYADVLRERSGESSALRAS
ncbi:MAG TPA: glycosyltransferase [Thermoanaerobaculia bacterium]|nr:glycosyltransferase [Thermoanaerobaculia bacterium]